MTNFNKLYNFILLSIISLNAESRKAMILKSTNILNKNEVKMFLITLPTKAADFLCKFFCSGLIKSIDDKRIQQVIDILLKNTSFDIQKNITLNDFLKQNEKYLNRSQASDPKYLDSIPEFYDKQEYEQGITVYKVKDSKEGQAAVRKIVDAQWGEDANPWCLIARNGLNNDLKGAWSLWSNQYNGYPKQIAFQNGLLLAFRAGAEDQHDAWWDRNDKPHVGIPLKDRKEVNVPVPLWTNELKKNFIKMFLDTFEIKLNPKTNMYDSLEDRTIQITDRMLINGKLPINFGVVRGNFEIYGCDELESLEGCPYEVWGRFNCSKNYRLTNLIGGPKKVHGKYICNYCHNLKSLLGAPQHCYSFDCSDCLKLASLEGGPTFIGHDYDCSMCKSLKNFKGAPKYVLYDFMANYCYNLTSLEGAPQDVHGSVLIHNNISLTSLLNGFKNVTGNFHCGLNDSLTSLIGAPESIDGDLVLRGCDNLTSLLGAPKQIGGDVSLDFCRRLKSLKGLEKVGGYIHCSYCDELQVTQEDHRFKFE